MHFLAQSQLRIVGLRIDVNNGASIERVELRTDMWPHWLRIAITEMESAHAARASNPGMGRPGDNQNEFSRALLREMRHSMTSICASAFAFEAFANSVVHNYPRAATASTPKNGAAGRVHQILLRGFKLSNDGSRAVRKTLQQVFDLRNKAVHSSAAFAQAVRHPVFPAAFEPRQVMYSVESASAACRSARDVLDQLPGLRRPGDGDWAAWCEAIPTMITEYVDV